jgi:hypothetical protein
LGSKAGVVSPTRSWLLVVLHLLIFSEVTSSRIQI